MFLSFNGVIQSRAYFWYVVYFQVERSIEKAASTSHRIPTLNPLASGVTPWNKDRKPVEKRKSAGVLLKRQYQRTIHILNKIVKNKVAGIAEEQVENHIDKDKLIQTLRL